MKTENLIQKESEQPITSELTKLELYRNYFCKKILVGTSIISFLVGCLLCAIHVVLLCPLVGLLPYPNGRQMDSFETSGLGIVACVTSIVAIIVTLGTYRQPTYAKLLLTLLTQFVVFGISVGIIVFPCLFILSDLNWHMKSDLFCNCIDADRNIVRNGTDPLDWICEYNTKVGMCDVIDANIAIIKRTLIFVWTMIACGVFQATLSIVPLLLALRTFWSIRTKFDSLAQSKCGDEDKKLESFDTYTENLNLISVRRVAYTQLGFLGFIFLYLFSAHSSDQHLYHITQFFVTGSFVLLNWASVHKSRMSYIKLTFVGGFHLFSTAVMITVVGLAISDAFGPGSNEIGLPFFILEFVLSVFTFKIFLNPILKVDRILETN